ncbi:hypothetical protein ACSZNV_02255 [Aeromonas hydrophila]
MLAIFGDNELAGGQILAHRKPAIQFCQCQHHNGIESFNIGDHMNPSLKASFADHQRRYELTDIMKWHIVSQLNGTVDAVRARAFWRTHLPNLAEAEGSEQLAEALASALEEVRRKLTPTTFG